VLPRSRPVPLPARQRTVEAPRGRKGAVVRSHYTGSAFQHAHGLSVFFPFAAEDYTSKYENLEFAERPGGDASCAHTCA
jgi:hypothetical protein